MKKIKVLPLLLVAPLLTSCGKSVKAPKFVKEGDKVEFSAFNSKFEEFGKDNALLPATDQKYPSFVAKRSSGNETVEKIERGGKDIFKSVNYSSAESSYEYDQANSLLKSVVKNNGSGEEKDSKGVKSTSKSSSKYTTIRQSYAEGDDKRVISVDVEEKEYSSYSKITEASSAEDILNGYIILNTAGDMTTVALSIALISSMTEEQLKDYSFFVNEGKKALTISFEHSDEPVENKTDDVLNYTTERKTINKYQVIFDKADSYKVLMYSESITTEKYAKDFSNPSHSGHSQFANGDVWSKVTKSASTYEMKKKDVKLKAADISKFAKIGSWN